MSQMINIYDISLEDQNSLWGNNHCPKCDCLILDINTSDDYTEFTCPRCDTVYYFG
jgi:uncharacterized paraquat-inducible protein A